MNQPKKRTSRLIDRRAMRPVSIDPNQFYSIEEAAAALDKSRAGLYNDLAAGKIVTVLDGSRRKVLGAEIIKATRAIADAAVAAPSTRGAHLHAGAAGQPPEAA